MHTLCDIYCIILLELFISCGGLMAKFEIPSIPPTTSKSIRFPNDIIEEVEEVIKGKDCTFSAFVIEAVKVALENLSCEIEIIPEDE